MHVTTLIDPTRTRQFAFLSCQRRPFDRATLIVDRAGEEWAAIRVAEQLIAIPTRRLSDGVTFGPTTERLLWIVHAELRHRRCREFRIPRKRLQHLIWAGRRSANWLRILMKSLKAVRDIQVGEWPTETDPPPLEKALPLFNRINDNKGAKEIVFEVGQGFLGSLEKFAASQEGDFDYDFLGGKKLKQLRRQGQVHDAYLPVHLGTSDHCKLVTARQKLILHTIIRELTVPPRESKKSSQSPRTLDDGEVVRGDLIRGFCNRIPLNCPDLDPDINHVGFNGNGCRRGQGYKLATWMKKAGYQDDESLPFLSDLKSLSNQLDLTPGAVSPTNKWIALSSLLDLTQQGQKGRSILQAAHLHVYGPCDFLDRWNRRFGWPTVDTDGTGSEVEDQRADILTELRCHLVEEGLEQQAVAAKLGISKQYLNVVLRGKKPCSQNLEEQIKDFLRGSESDPPSTDSSLAIPQLKVARPRVEKDSDQVKKIALRYYDLGWSIVPMELAEKKPFVKWKEYQERRPSKEQIVEWWEKWPNAGIGVVLGPVSKLFCVDVDGEKPHRILMELLGSLPHCPTVKSGSDDPFRYHLYFRHPDAETKGKSTPFNNAADKEKLELRGRGGIVVLPPSLHKSGRRYGWCRGRGYSKIELPSLPTKLIEALSVNTRSISEGHHAVDLGGIQLASSTLEFLSGKLSQAKGWNDRLFQAGCDMCAHRVPLEQAKPVLLKGACPNTAEDEQIAINTIDSAYSTQRVPSRS